MIHHPMVPRRTTHGGFALLDVLLGLLILALGLLAHVASTFSEVRLSKDGRYRSEALQASQQFIERLRADDDFRGLYLHAATLQGYVVPTDPTGTTGGTDPIFGMPGGTPIVPDPTPLSNGEQAYALTAYYPDLVLSEALAGSLVVRVEVPWDETAPGVLREDLVLPEFGLPADLNGDGTIDSEGHQDDYLALPITLTFRWTPPGEPSSEMHINTWIRGTE